MSTNKAKEKHWALVSVLELVIFTGLLLFDQWTKALSVEKLSGGRHFPLIRGVLEFYYLENHGAAFSLFQNALVFLSAVAVITLAILAFLLFRTPHENPFYPMRILFVMVCAGAAGNLIDRLKFNYVRDFIYFSLINFPVFNMADIYVCVAMFFLVILVMFVYKDEDLKQVFPGQKG